MTRTRVLVALAAGLVIGAVTIGVLGRLGTLSSRPAPRAIPPTGQAEQPEAGGSIRSFDLTAAVTTHELGPGLQVPVWAYNGSVPGPELRVTTGDLVQVRFHNRLPEGSTIHWHGVPLPNGQDGVAGVTQDPVAPGADVTY